jgi:hypothetical protein
MNYKNLLTSDYWFDVDRTRLHVFDKTVLGVAIGLVLLSGVLYLVKRKVQNPFDKQIAEKLAVAIFWLGVLEALWFGLRFEYVAMLGTKFVATLIAVAFGIRIIYLLIKYLRNRKAALVAWQKEQTKLKYLPKQG